MVGNCRESVDKIKQSRIQIEIAKLLRENPYMVDNLRGLSRWLALSEELVAPELEELVTLGVLGKYGDGPGAIYSYTRDTKMITCLDQFWHEVDQALKEMKAGETRWGVER